MIKIPDTGLTKARKKDLKRPKGPRRKHRLYIDVTFSQVLTRRKAAKALEYHLHEAHLGAQAVYKVYVNDGLFVDKLSITEPGSHEKAYRKGFADCLKLRERIQPITDAWNKANETKETP